MYKHRWKYFRLFLHLCQSKCISEFTECYLAWRQSFAFSSQRSPKATRPRSSLTAFSMASERKKNAIRYMCYNVSTWSLKNFCGSYSQTRANTYPHPLAKKSSQVHTQRGFPRIILQKIMSILHFSFYIAYAGCLLQKNSSPAFPNHTFRVSLARKHEFLARDGIRKGERQ